MPFFLPGETVICLPGILNVAQNYKIVLFRQNYNVKEFIKFQA